MNFVPTLLTQQERDRIESCLEKLSNKELFWALTYMVGVRFSDSEVGPEDFDKDDLIQFFFGEYESPEAEKEVLLRAIERGGTIYTLIEEIEDKNPRYS